MWVQATAIRPSSSAASPHIERANHSMSMSLNSYPFLGPRKIAGIFSSSTGGSGGGGAGSGSTGSSNLGGWSSAISQRSRPRSSARSFFSTFTPPPALAVSSPAPHAG